MRRVFPILLVLGVLLGAAAPLHGQDVGLPLGSVPESVTLEDLDGNAVDLGRWVGKRPVLIEFWAHWCEQCEALLPQLEAAARKHAGRAEVLVVAVGVNQTRRSVRRHADEHALPGTLLYDGAGRAVRAFRAPATSYVVALDAAGRVVYTGSGGGQNLVAALDRAVGAR